MIVIPAVDILGGRVVRLVQGDYDAVTAYGDDPVGVASGWIADGARIVHVVDLEGARSGVPSPNLWAMLGAAGVSFQVGGGIRDGVTASRAIAAGATRVVVGSAAVHGGTALHGIVDAVGPSGVVAAIDVRNGRAVGSGWLDEGASLASVVASVAEAGIGTALVTGIERDGALDGPNMDILASVRSMAPDLSLIASGGVGTLGDLKRLSSDGYSAAIVGRALYEGRFTLSEAIAAAT